MKEGVTMRTGVYELTMRARVDGIVLITVVGHCPVLKYIPSRFSRDVERQQLPKQKCQLASWEHVNVLVLPAKAT
jgi:hypothetical protein